MPEIWGGWPPGYAYEYYRFGECISDDMACFCLMASFIVPLPSFTFSEWYFKRWDPFSPKASWLCRCYGCSDCAVAERRLNDV